jgi:hypothetical protein
MEQLAYLLGRLREIREGDTSLLDNTMLVYGGCIGDGNRHDHNNLPILLAGGGGGQLSPGRHIQYPAKTPLMNLHAALLDRMGVRDNMLGDATGQLEGI